MNSRAGILPNFSQRLLALRLAHGRATNRPKLKATEFAAELGITAERYRRYERAEMEPPLEVLAAIRIVTGACLCTLITGRKPGREDLIRPSDNPLSITFGRRLRWAREVFGASVEDVARVMRIKPAVWLKYEADARRPRPTLQQMEEFAHRFSVSLDFLYRGILTGIDDDIRRALEQVRRELDPYVGTSTATASRTSDPEPESGDVETRGRDQPQ